MSESLYLGFDGGATKTTGTAIDINRNVIAEETGGPSNFLLIGTDEAASNIINLTESILRTTNRDFADIKVVFLGLTGAGRATDARRMKEAFVFFLRRRLYPVPEVCVGSDADAALEGAFAGDPGLVLISGTGSILFAKDNAGNVHRVGGWGRLIGDEGSGYTLGRSCLSAIAKEFDGRGQKTSMSGYLRDRYAVDTPDSLIAEVYRNGLDIASLAPVVMRAADEGDEVAVGIATAAAAELAEHIRAVLPALGGDIPVVLSGSVLSTDNFISKKLRSLLAETLPGIVVQEPEFPPSFGAALLALKAERHQ